MQTEPVDTAGMDRDRIYDRRWWTLAVLCLSLPHHRARQHILNVALPTWSRDLHPSGSAQQWIVASYTILYASVLLTTGASVTASAARNS